MPNDRKSAEASSEIPEKKEKSFIEKIKGFKAWVGVVKSDPLWGIVFAATTLVLGVLGNEAYTYARNKMLGPDEFLVQIREEQARNFTTLKEGLSKLDSLMQGQGGSVFAEVRNAAASLRKDNENLLSQLTLAKLENERLSQNLAQRGGIRGGYDFIISKAGGLRIDKGTVIGLPDVANNGVMVNLHSSDGDIRRFIASGESIDFNNAMKQACSVSLLTISGDLGSASFALACAGK